MSLLIRKLVLGAVALLGVLLLLALVAWWRFDRFLGSDDCRRVVARAVENATGIPGEFMPFARTGSAIYTEGYEGRGGPASPLARLRVDQARAELNMRSLFGEAFRVEQVTLQRLRADLQRPAAGVVEPARIETTQSGRVPASAALLPRRVDLGQVVIRDAGVTWPSGVSGTGRLDGVQVTLVPAAGVVQVTAIGGVLAEAGLPKLRVEEVRARWNAPELFLTAARLRCGERGVVDADGEVLVGARPRIQVSGTLREVPVRELVSGDWRARLHGELSGTFEWTRKREDEQSVIRGQVSVVDGRVEALPILDEIARFTKTDEFRSVKLDRAGAEFVWTATGLTITNLQVEARGLLRVEGSVVFRPDGRLEGWLEVGTTAPRLASIPGADTKVFTGQRDGYLWASPGVRLSGTRTKVVEDLSPRLRDAAMEALQDNFKDAVQGAPDKARDAIRKGMELFDSLLR